MQSQLPRLQVPGPMACNNRLRQMALGVAAGKGGREYALKNKSTAGLWEAGSHARSILEAAGAFIFLLSGTYIV